jgi:Zn-dependent protease with chaperone function
VTYFLYGVTLAFTWFLALNIALSLVVAASVDAVAARVGAYPPAVRARVLFWLRLLPAALSTVFVAAVFAPSFLALEPRAFDEAFGLTTTAFVAGSCLIVAAGALRGAAALRHAAARARGWLAHAQPIALDGATLPVYCLDAEVPAMTLVGVLRPRLLVTRPLLGLLTGEEVRAALAHELAHCHTFDNLRRLLMRAVPDALSLFRASRRLEREWAQAAEHAADARSARDARMRLALASALVKVARLTPASPRPALASPLVGGDGIASRIAQLIDPPAQRLSARARVITALAAAALILAVLTGYDPLLAGVHQISEVLVHALP